MASNVASPGGSARGIAGRSRSQGRPALGPAVVCRRRERLDQIIAHLETDEVAQMDHAAVEALVGRDGREVLRRLLQGHFELRALREEREPMTGADGEVRHHQRTCDRGMTRVFGSHPLTRLQLRARGVEGGLRPLDAELNLARTAARRAGVTPTFVLDVIHVLEYLWNAAWCLFSQGDPEAEAWVTERLRRLLEGDVSGVAAGIRRSATKRSLEPAERAAMDKCADYLLKYKSMLRYDEYLAAGFPIATGVIEGACRHLIQDRMDITGARWGLDRGEAVLKLRALRSSGDFDAYLARELERNHLADYAAHELTHLRAAA